MQIPPSDSIKRLGWAIAFLLPSVSLFADDSPNVHLLIFGNTRDKAISQSVSVDKNYVYTTFSGHFAEGELVVGGSYQNQPPDGIESRDWILEQVRTHSLEPQDTLVVYFSGLGGIDNDVGNHLMTASGPLLRHDLIEAMQSRGVRLAVLITDGCTIRRHLVDTAASSVFFTEVTSPLFDSLYFQSEGFVDLSALSPDEVAMGDDDDGGYLTRALCGFLRQNHQQRLTWRDVKDDVQDRIDKLFAELHPKGVRHSVDDNVLFTQTIAARLEVTPDPGADTHPLPTTDPERP